MSQNKPSNLIQLSKELMGMSLAKASEAERLQYAARLLRGEEPGGYTREDLYDGRVHNGRPKKQKKGKRQLSEVARASISRAQKKRWALFHKKGKKAA